MEDRSARRPNRSGMGLKRCPIFGSVAHNVHDIPYAPWYTDLSWDNQGSDPVEVLERPTKSDIAELLKRGSGTARVIRDTRTGDLFVWDAEEALHEEVIRHLGLSDSAENMGQIHSVRDFEWMAGKR